MLSLGPGGRFPKVPALNQSLDPASLSADECLPVPGTSPPGHLGISTRGGGAGVDVFSESHLVQCDDMVDGRLSGTETARTTCSVRNGSRRESQLQRCGLSPSSSATDGALWTVLGDEGNAFGAPLVAAPPAPHRPGPLPFPSQTPRPTGRSRPSTSAPRAR